MRKVSVECEVVTPLFSRGSLHGSNFELRPQSIKGLLRFWFRTIVPLVIDISYYQLSKNDVLDHYIGLKKLEEIVFGSTTKKSPFSIDVETKHKFEKINSLIYRNQKPKKNDYTFSYILYGMYSQKDQPDYNYLPPEARFVIKLNFRETSDSFIKLILTIFKLLSYYGGIGAKSRKGFGSFEIVKINGFENISSENENIVLEARNTLKKFLDSIDEKSRENFNIDLKDPQRIDKYIEIQDFPNFLFFWDALLPKKFDKYEYVIKELYKSSRDKRKLGIYRKIKLFDLRNYKKFEDFVEKLRKTILIGKEPKGLVCKPAILGLPLIYQRLSPYPHKSGNEKISIFNTINNEKARKASPLFISIHKDKNNKYFARFLILPSKISPNRKLWVFHEKGGNQNEEMKKEIFSSDSVEDYIYLKNSIEKKLKEVKRWQR